jgi:hypothetical protein
MVMDLLMVEDHGLEEADVGVVEGRGLVGRQRACPAAAAAGQRRRRQQGQQDRSHARSSPLSSGQQAAPEGCGGLLD